MTLPSHSRDEPISLIGSIISQPDDSNQPQCRVDFKSGIFVESKSGKSFSLSPHLFSPFPDLGIVAEKNNRANTLLRFPQHCRQSAVNMVAQPNVFLASSFSVKCTFSEVLENTLEIKKQTSKNKLMTFFNLISLFRKTPHNAGE